MASRSAKNQKVAASGSSEWEKILVVNFNDEDRKTCVQLLANAMIMEDGLGVWDEARAVCQAKVKDLHAQGTWKTVLNEISDYKSRRAGSMTDASKGQRSTSPQASGRAAIPAIPEHGLGDFTPPRAYPGDLPARNPRSPGAQSSTSESSSASTVPAADHRVRPLAYALPRGVVSMEEWGQTVIGFGKFGGKKMTYYALAILESDEAGSYRYWVMSRTDVANEALSDLARYLQNAVCMGFLGTRIAGLRAAQRKEFQREMAKN